MNTSTATYVTTPLAEIPPQSNSELAESISGLCVDVVGLEDDTRWLIGKVHELLEDQRTNRLALGDALTRLDDAAVVVGRLERRVAELERGVGA